MAPEPQADVQHVADAVLYPTGLPFGTNGLLMSVTANTVPFVGRG